MAAQICGSDDGHTPVNSDVSPDVQIVDISQVGHDWDSRRAVRGAGHPKDIPGGRVQRCACVKALATKVRDDYQPLGSEAADSPAMVGTDDIPQVGRLETIRLSSPPDSGQLPPDSPQTIAFEDMVDSSVPLSYNRVQAGKSQDVPDDGSLFKVSAVSPGFLMRPSGAAVQQPGAGLPLPLALNSFSDPVLGDPIAFDQCALIPGSDTTFTLPVYTMPSGIAYMPGQSSVQTVMASAASTRLEGWSSDMARIADNARVGPFDAYASPMDKEDSPLVTTGLPGFPYRLTSYNRPATADVNPAFGLQLIGVHLCDGVGSAVVSFTSVLGGSTRRRKCYSSSGQLAEGRWRYVVKPSDSFAVCYVAASNVVGDDVHRDGTCGVPCRRDRRLVYSSNGALGGQVHGCDGSVAPTDWSGRSRASAGLVLQHLHELSILFSRGSASSGVMCLLLRHFLLEHYGLDYDVMSCEHFLPVGRLPWLCGIYIGLALRAITGCALCCAL